MDRDSRQSAALARRTKLQALIADLQRELSQVEKEIRVLGYSPGIHLTQDFFWTYVFPLLEEAGEEGMTGAKMREKLAQIGLPVESGKFRVFLSRSKQRGFINLMSRNRWRLAEGAEKLRPTD